MKLIKSTTIPKKTKLSDFAIINKENIKKEIDDINYLDIANAKSGEIIEIKKIKGKENFPSRAKRVAKKGDSVFSTVRPNLRGFAKIKEKDLVVSTGFAVVSPKSENYNDFIYYALSSNRSLSWMLSICEGGNYPAFKASSLVDFSLIDITEKEALKIGIALSQQEEQVNKIKTLIEKLEKRNQYYAERLLSGELRIRQGADGGIEFYENEEWREIKKNKEIIMTPINWEIVKLCEIGFVKTSSVNKVIDEVEILVDLVNYMDVYKSNSKKIFNDMALSKTSCKDNQIKENNLIKGDLLITPSSETRDDIGHSVVVMEDLVNKVYSYHLVRFRFNEDSNITLNFKPYIFNSKGLRNQFERYAQGITRMTLKKDSIERCYLKIPTKQEQILISDFLNKLFEEKNKLKELLEKEQKRFNWMSDALLSGEYQIVD